MTGSRILLNEKNFQAVIRAVNISYDSFAGFCMESNDSLTTVLPWLSGLGA